MKLNNILLLIISLALVPGGAIAEEQTPPPKTITIPGIAMMYVLVKEQIVQLKQKDGTKKILVILKRGDLAISPRAAVLLDDPTLTIEDVQSADIAILPFAGNTRLEVRFFKPGQTEPFYKQVIDAP